MKNMERIVFGPVPSRRLGQSLGINNIPPKICSYSCLYCQIGRTFNISTERKEFYPVGKIVGETEKILGILKERNEKVDYLTFVPDGEPTLDLNLGREIKELKKFGIKIAVITNASLLSNASIRSEIINADLIVPSLDAVTQERFIKIDRPHNGIMVEDIINGLILLRREFKGRIWLEVMLVKGVNDDIRHIRRLKEAVDMINPDKIQINSPVRTASEAGVSIVSMAKLKKIKDILGEKSEII